MKSFLVGIFREALLEIGAPEDTPIQLETPRSPEHGDVACNVAMSLSRALKQSPRAIAEQLVAALKYNPSDISSVEIAGPGFINIRLTPEFWRGQLSGVLELGAGYGKSDIGEGIKTNVEYVSANPTGPLHTGHSIGAALGDTIANLLAWTGYDVTREYYFNNAGNQMRNLALTINARYRELLGLPFEWDEENFYKGDYIIEIARDLLAERGEALAGGSEEDVEAMRAFGEGWNFKKIIATLESFNVRHDVYFNEDSLYKEGKIKETIDDLTNIGRTYEKDGAVWLKLEDMGMQDRVIVKSSGEPTYRLPDIAYHREKYRRGFRRIVDVFGADHIATAADVKAAVGLLGFDTSNIEIVMNQMATFIEGGEPVKFSKRSGKALTLDTMIEEFGADVVRFFFIMRGVNTHLEFDLDLAREQSEKNPLFYLQYAHARIAGVLRHAEQEGIIADAEASLDPLEAEEELSLIKQIIAFPESVQRAARDLEPQIVSEYLRELAAAFHKFYHNCRVIIDDIPLRNARLRLLQAAKQTFANGLTILGVGAPERM